MEYLMYRGFTVGEDGVWVYGSLQEGSPSEIITEDGVSHQCVPSSVGLSTTQKDSYGTEIYENDILAVMQGVVTILGPVKHDDKGFFVRFYGDKEDLIDWSIGKVIYVVGNLYTDKHLLDKTQL